MDAQKILKSQHICEQKSDAGGSTTPATNYVAESYNKNSMAMAHNTHTKGVEWRIHTALNL
jgi:hypothetical protein